MQKNYRIFLIMALQMLFYTEAFASKITFCEKLWMSENDTRPFRPELQMYTADERVQEKVLARYDDYYAKGKIDKHSDLPRKIHSGEIKDSTPDIEFASISIFSVRGHDRILKFFQDIGFDRSDIDHDRSPLLSAVMVFSGVAGLSALIYAMVPEEFRISVALFGGALTVLTPVDKLFKESVRQQEIETLRHVLDVLGSFKSMTSEDVISIQRSSAGNTVDFMFSYVDREPTLDILVWRYRERSAP